jgi:hypothetical protein
MRRTTGFTKAIRDPENERNHIVLEEVPASFEADLYIEGEWAEGFSYNQEDITEFEDLVEGTTYDFTNRADVKKEHMNSVKRILKALQDLDTMF